MSCGALQGASDVVRRNPEAWDAVGVILHIVGYALTSSFFLASLGLPMLAAHGVLLVLLGDCEADPVTRAAARQAVAGFDIALASLAVVGIVNPAAGEVSALLRPLRNILASYAGSSPIRGSDVSDLANASSESADIDTSVGRDVARNLGADDAAITAAERAAGEHMEPDDGLAPMLTWQPLDGLVAGVSSRNPNNAANEYSHAYQEAAEAAYAVDPTVDLRPWLLAQTAVDVSYVTGQRITEWNMATALGFSSNRRARIAALDEVLRRLGLWQTAAASPPFGAWSRSSVLRVVRSSDLQQNIPVVVDNDDDDGNDEGVSTGTLLGIAAAAAGLLLAFK